MDKQLQEWKEFLYYKKERWTTRLHLSFIFATIIACGGYKAKANIWQTFGHWNFVVDLSLLLVLVALTFTFIHWVSLLLDGPLPWESKFESRFIAQFMLGFFGGYSFMEYLNNTYVIYGGRDLLRNPYGITQIPGSFMVSIVANSYYFGLYFAEQYMNMTNERTTEMGEPSTETTVLKSEDSEITEAGSLVVNDKLVFDNLAPIATQLPEDDATTIATEQEVEPERNELPWITSAKGEQLLLAHLDIAAAGLEHGTLTIYTYDGMRYTDERGVDKFFQLLDSDEYFKASRSAIIRRKAVKSLKPSGKNNKSLIVTLHVEVPFKIEVAQRNVKIFKEWLATKHATQKPSKSRPLPMLF